MSFEGWSSYARPLCVKLSFVPIERAGIVGGHLVLVNFPWALWRHRWLLLLLLQLCQVTSASLLVSTTRCRVCLIDTILGRGSIPNIAQYLGKEKIRYTTFYYNFSILTIRSFSDSAAHLCCLKWLLQQAQILQISVSDAGSRYSLSLSVTVNFCRINCRWHPFWNRAVMLGSNFPPLLGTLY